MAFEEGPVGLAKQFVLGLEQRALVLDGATHGMTSGGMGTCRPRYTNRMVGRPWCRSPAAYSQRRGRDAPGAGTRTAARVLLHRHAVLRRAVLAGRRGQCLQSDAAGIRGAIPQPPAATTSVVIRTASGPGARDGFEAVTRAVTDGRYTVDRRWPGPTRAAAAEFRLPDLDRRATATLCCATASSPPNSSTSQANPTASRRGGASRPLKAQLAQRMLAASAEDVYESARNRLTGRSVC